MTKIVQDVSKLKTPLTKLPKNKQEQDVLSAALMTSLTKHKGFGLSANQIGVDKRICVVNVKDPMGQRIILQLNAAQQARRLS